MNGEVLVQRLGLRRVMPVVKLRGHQEMPQRPEVEAEVRVDQNSLERRKDQIGIERLGCIFILPGKFNRIEVGFIYSKNNSALPKITPGIYIYIEEVLLKWYVSRAM